MANDQYVQYGCGLSGPVGWVNFDASPTLRWERIPLLGRLYTKNRSRFSENVAFGDIIKGLPIPEDSCKGVYCSHVLEHLCLEDGRQALRNTYRMLEQGGTFRLVVPDLEFEIRQYLADDSPEAAFTFLDRTLLGSKTRKRNVKTFLVNWLGNSRHYWMWDYKSLELELAQAGFVEIRRAQFGDSSDPKFEEVEMHDRWENCLGIECAK